MILILLEKERVYMIMTTYKETLIGWTTDLKTDDVIQPSQKVVKKMGTVK